MCEPPGTHLRLLDDQAEALHMRKRRETRRETTGIRGGPSVGRHASYPTAMAFAPYPVEWQQQLVPQHAEDMAVDAPSADRSLSPDTMRALELEQADALTRLQFDLYLQERIALEAEAQYHDALSSLLLPQQPPPPPHPHLCQQRQLPPPPNSLPSFHPVAMPAPQVAVPMPLSPLRSSTNLMSMMSSKRMTEGGLEHTAKRQRGAASFGMSDD